MSEVARGGILAGERNEETTSSPRARDATTLPDRREFWMWVWYAIRPVVGWILAGLGALALFLGWYGVSGQSLTAKQLPYLVSGGLTGIALVIIAGVFIATEDIRRQLSRVDDLQRKIDDLYSLFVEDLVTAPPGERGTATAVNAQSTASTSSLVALPTGTSYHRSECALVSGKDDARPVDAQVIRTRKLRACRVCDPPTAG